MTEMDVDTSVASAQALIKNARRLGLTWTLTPGTTDVNNRVLLDGDEGNQSIDALSLVGNQRPGRRVMCLEVIDGGIYILGTIDSVPPRGAPMAKLRRAVSQTFAVSGTADLIDFDTVDYDPYNGFDEGTPDQWVVPFDGWYHVDCRIAWNSNATSRRAAFVDVNGLSSGITVCGSSLNAAATGTTQLGGSGSMELVQGDTLGLRGIQNSGGSLGTSTSDMGSVMTVTYLGPS